MEDDYKILTTYDNKQVELVFSESFLCPTRNIGIIDLQLGKKIYNWKLRLVFEEKEGTVPFSTKWEYNIEGFEIKLTLFNWISPNWVELNKPQLIQTKTESDNFYFKLRTDGHPGFEHARKIDISIWKAI